MTMEKSEVVQVPEGLHADLEEQGIILSLKPGDKIVLMFRHRISDSEYEAVRASALRAFGTDQVVILSEGIRLAVLRTEGGA